MSATLRSILRNSGFLLTALLIVCLRGLAQDQATIVGTATDSSGAVIPGVKVTVANAQRGFTRETAANSAGEYTVAKVPIGDYIVTAEAPGFQKLVRTGINLAVGQTLRVDLQLTIGQITQEINVSGNVTKVVTENGTVSDVITGKQVAELNLNGRNFLALTTLVPGAAPQNSFDPTHIGFGASQLRVYFSVTRITANNVENAVEIVT
jgi:hypothetical protein